MAAEIALDEEFKRVISEMKPHARLLPRQSDERHKVTLWIKKLLGLETQKKERNKYAQLLLHALKGTKLSPPFTDDPPAGSLPVIAETNRCPFPNDLESLLLSSPEDGESSPPPSPPRLPSSSFPPSHGPRPPTTLHQGPSHSKRDASKRTHSHTLPSSVSPRDGRPQRRYNPLSPPKTRESVSRGASSLLGRSRQSEAHRSGSKRSDETNGSRSRRTVSFGKEGVPLRQSNYRWNEGEGLLSSGRDLHSSAFRPKLTSTLTASAGLEGGGRSLVGAWKGGRDVAETASGLSDDSLMSDGDTLFSDEGSMDGDISDVAALLQSRSSSRQPGVTVPSSSSRASFSGGSVRPMGAQGSPRKLDISRELLHAREVDLKVRSAETQFQEEKLKLQRQHEESLKQVLDRKNNELEDTRSEHRIQTHQLESQCKKLERKVSQLESECKHLREQRDRHRTDAQRSSQHIHQQLQDEFDRKLHEAIMGCEREKLELEQAHSQQVQRVLDESSAQTTKMEREYAAQSQANSEIIQELEERVEEMTTGAKAVQQAHSRLAREKVTVEQQCSTLQDQLHEARERAVQLEREVGTGREERESEVSELRVKLEQTVHDLQHQHSLQEAQTSQQLAQLKEEASHWQHGLEEERKRHQQQATELEASFHRQLHERDLEHERQLTALRAETREKESQARDREAALEQVLREQEQQLQELRSAQELRSQQAERAIKDFKSQVEHQTNEMFDQMRQELEKMEADLAHSRAQREKQAKEYERQRQENRKWAEKEVSDLRLQHEREKTELSRRHKQETQALLLERDKFREASLAELTATMRDTESQAEARAARDAKTISSLETQLGEARLRLDKVHSSHKAELTALRQRAEEERRTASRINESAISKLRTQIDSQRGRLKEEHKAEIQKLSEKHSHLVQKLEHDFAMRSSKSTETISSLQAQVKFLQQDLQSRQRSFEEQISELTQRNEEERGSLKQHHETLAQSLQEEAEAAQAMVSQLEETARQLHLEHNSAISHLKLQHEKRLQGMLSASVRQEYESTIKSLRAQVGMLTQRAALLQEELDRRRPASSHVRLTGSLGSPSGKATIPR